MCVLRKPVFHVVSAARICKNIDFNYVRYKPGRVAQVYACAPKSVPTRVHFYTQFSISITLHYMFVSGRVGLERRASGFGCGPSSGADNIPCSTCVRARACRQTRKRSQGAQQLKDVCSLEAEYTWWAGGFWVTDIVVVMNVCVRKCVTGNIRVPTHTHTPTMGPQFCGCDSFSRRIPSGQITFSLSCPPVSFCSGFPFCHPQLVLSRPAISPYSYTP